MYKKKHNNKFDKRMKIKVLKCQKLFANAKYSSENLKLLKFLIN